MSEEQQLSPVQQKKYQNQSSLDDITKLYLNAKTADVHFQFGSDDRVPAHKSLLSVSSKVFDAMFFGDLKENGDIQITDSSAAAFKEFLQFFYLKEIELTEENIGEVMYLVQKYNVSNGVNSCVDFLKDILTVDNVSTGLSIAILFEHKELMQICEKIIIMDTNAVFKSAGFLECEQKTLDHILKMDILSCSEAKVFEACMRWVKSKSKQDVVTKELVDLHIGKSFYEIRFASMTMQELCTLPTEYDGVLAEDCRTITKIISVPGYSSDKFIKCPRFPKWNEDAIIICDRMLSDKQSVWLGKASRSVVVFSSTELLLLGEFECYKMFLFNGNTYIDLKSDVLINVKITEGHSTENREDTKVLLNMKAKLGSKNKNVSLPQPILIKPEYFYTIHMEKFPNGLFVHGKKLKNKVKMNSNITIEFYESLDANGTFLSALNFNQIKIIEQFLSQFNKN